MAVCVYFSHDEIDIDIGLATASGGISCHQCDQGRLRNNCLRGRRKPELRIARFRGPEVVGRRNLHRRTPKRAVRFATLT